MATTSPVKILFGAGGIGEGKISRTWNTGSETSELLNDLQELGLTQLDSAASYPPGAPWVTSRLLGETKAVERGFVVDSKILGSGGLSEKAIDECIEKDLKLLGVERVNIMYSHVPDINTPIEESARAFDKHYRAGKFKELGLCNYGAADMQEWLQVCEKFGYVKPTVWQGHYNTIQREAEKQLFPLLRKYGIRIIAYGPLAGGFLTGKVTLATSSNSTLSGGRWEPGRFAVYPEIFNKPGIHEAMLNFIKKCEGAGLSPTEVSLRWIMWHSALKDGDGIILGATRVDQLKGNVEICRKGKLGDEMVGACEELWESVEEVMGTLFGSS